MKNWLFLLFSAALLASCNPEEIVPDFDSGTDYQPLAIQKYWEYAYDSIIYDDDGQTIINSSGFLKREIADTLANGQYRLRYSVRKNSNDPWQVTRVERIYIEGNKLFESDQNLLFVNLVFPVEKGRTWDGNAFFNTNENQFVAGEAIQVYKDWSYEMVDLGVERHVEGVVFDKVLEITQADRENAIELRKSQSAYAKDVGLIYRKMEIYDTQKINPSLPWHQKAEAGFSLEWRLLNHN